MLVYQRVGAQFVRVTSMYRVNFIHKDTRRSTHNLHEKKKQTMSKFSATSQSVALHILRAHLCKRTCLGPPIWVCVACDRNVVYKLRAHVMT